MLTDTALRNLKPKSLTYKVSDRNGMYVTVSPAGTVTFRYDYRLHGRRETLTIGRYGALGISLALAREKLLDAKKAVMAGRSPALEKQREKRRLTAAKHFGDLALKWLADAKMADSTRAMRKHVIDRDILPVFQNRLLNEITADDLRALCNKVKARGAPATAVHVRDIVKQVYAFAILHGEKVDNRIVIAGRDSAHDSINQVGQEMTRRNMNIQPTLTERPGLPVRVIANRDLVLRPYQPLFVQRGGRQ